MEEEDGEEGEGGGGEEYEESEGSSGKGVEEQVREVSTGFWTMRVRYVR